jgi:hypothetical protein
MNVDDARKAAVLAVLDLIQRLAQQDAAPSSAIRELAEAYDRIAGPSKTLL